MACQVREVAVGVHHPSLVGVEEAVGEAYLDHKAAVVVAAEVAFQAREGVVEAHQSLQVMVEVEEGVGVEVEVGIG